MHSEIASKEIEVEEGETYTLEHITKNFPNRDTPSGSPEVVGHNELAVMYGDYYLTFEWHSVKCTDVTHVDDL